MTYFEVIKYLNSFINFERKTQYSYRQSFKLERFKKFLKIINNPQAGLNVIHIAGSKGKGSVCAFIAYILKEAGFKVGLYTSPHLSDFRERIRVLRPKANNKQFLNADIRQSNADLRKLNLRKLALDSRESALKNSFLTDFEGMISKKEIFDLVTKLKPEIDKFNKTSKCDALTHSTLRLHSVSMVSKVEPSTSLEVNPEPVEGLTFFEVYTAIAFQHFKDKKVNFAVLETGLGGRLDATNTCNSLISVITPISLEHTNLLGNTLKKIAFEKAAIIKKENKKTPAGKILALTSKQDKSVMDVLDNIAGRNNALFLKEGKDFKFFIRNSSFDYRGLNYSFDNLKINLLGSHQIANASLAVASIEALRYHSINVGEKAIREGLKKCLWPARLEMVSKKPLIVLDGAHNSTSVKVLHKGILEKFPNREIWLIFGISKDKELKDTCREIKKFNAKIILTKSGNPRAAQPQYLLKYFSNNSMILTNTTKDALNIAQANAQKQDLILITGSLFVCAEAREELKKRE